MEERATKIVEACLQQKSKNPIAIFLNIAQEDFIRIHGPEHHILDAASLLTAFYNAGGLEDPTGKSDDEFRKIIKEIEYKILQLKDKLV